MSASEASAPSAERVALDYFAAIARRDLDGLAAYWAPDGRDRISGQLDATGPAEVRAYFEGLFAAFPDFRMEVLQHVASGDGCAVHWRAAGTFSGPGRFQGLAPTGARVQLQGIDLLRARAGLLVANDAFVDGMSIARQLGVLPPQGSSAEQAMFGAFNAKTAATRPLAGSAPEQVADGVWIVRGGFPQRTFNAYLIRDGEGVALFDAGCRQMAAAIATAAAQLGGLTRIVIGNGHADHRGAVPRLALAVHCHPDAEVELTGAGGRDYMRFDDIAAPARWLMPRLLAFWDGGPVEIAGHVQEGDAIGGFRVVETPGHSRGHIALYRDADGVALSSDAFSMLDIATGRALQEPRLPTKGSNWDFEQARASLRKLAAFELRAAWPGHGPPVTDDVGRRLQRAAA